MSIKDQLRAAILSGGAEGSSESTSTVVSILASNYVAPADGTIYLLGRAKATGGTSLAIHKNDIASSAFTAQTEATWFNSLSIRVRKCDAIRLYSYNVAEVFANFVKLVGGGLKSLWHSLFGGLCHA